MLYRLFVADHGDVGHRRPSLEAVLSSDPAHRGLNRAEGLIGAGGVVV